VTHWENLDFERLYRVLRVAAESVVRHAPPTFNMGLSAQDLAHETFHAFLDSPTGLGWNPALGTIEKYLTGVLWRKARTHLRRDRKVGGSLDDSERRHSIPAAAGSLEAEVQFVDLRAKIFEALGDDQELRDLIVASEHTSGEHNVNQELAEILGKPVRSVVNLKRRLLNNKKVVRFLWPEKRE
jgi:DNA-directed RNA polymerase specialized sigma24 family protein